jgi:hypothetical protein
MELSRKWLGNQGRKQYPVNGARRELFWWLLERRLEISTSMPSWPIYRSIMPKISKSRCVYAGNSSVR